MPQLNQLALVAQSQLFWLLLVLAFLYFGIGKLMLPKVQSTVEARIRSSVALPEEALAAADAALAEIEEVAAEAAQDMVRRLAGVKVTAADARQAVQAAMANG